MKYAFLGLGFVQGWLWLFFLNGPLLFSEAEGWSINNELILLCFLLANSLAFLWVAKKTIGSIPFYSQNLMLVTSAFLMSSGVLMVKFTAGQIGEVQYVVLALLGTVVAGFGSAILIVALGELFSFFSIINAGLSFAGSVTIGSVLFFVAFKSSIPLAFLLTALSPLIGLIFIILGRKKIPELDLNVVKNPAVFPPLLPFPFPRKLVYLLILFYLAGGFFYKLILLSSATFLQDSYWLTNVIYWLTIVIAGSCRYLFPNLDLSVFYRPVLPLLGAGFLLYPFFNELTIFLPLTLLQAGFALFDLYTWLLFAYIAKYYPRPSYVFGWGMFLITISIFIGETVFAALFSKITFSMEEVEIVSICAALLMIAGTMLFQGNRDSFAGWEGPENLVTDASYVGQNPTEQKLMDEVASTSELSELAPPPLEEVGVLRSDNLGETKHQKLECTKKESAATIENIESINTNALREQFLLSLELTKREKDVAILLFDGRNNPYIRGLLNISNNTLKTHLKNIYRKASINDRQQLLDLYSEFVIEKESRTLR